MSFFQWRRFNFFDLAKDVDDGRLAEALKNVTLTCTSSGRGHLILGDDHGQLHFLNRHHQLTTMKVLEGGGAGGGGVALLHQLKQSGILLVAGREDDEDGTTTTTTATTPYTLKVFNLDRPDRLGNPSLVRSLRLVLPASSGQASSPAPRPVALAAHENQTLMAVGYDNGAVVLYRGDLSRDRGTRQKLLLEGVGASRAGVGVSVGVSGMSFRTFNKATYLYVATPSQVVCFNVSAKDKETQASLDSVGCPQGLAIAADSLSDTHFITGRNDAVYCYTPESRGQCYAFDGHKVALHWFRNYLIVVTADDSSSGSGGSPLSADSAAASAKHVLTIFDVQNKLVAFTAPVRPVRAVLSEWGLLYAVTLGDNRLYQLTEKDVQSKLDVLFKKNFYDLAVKIAKLQQYDEDGLVDIFRQYGDHLYAKGDFAGAIDNYVKTIGHLEPSYVIRKFLDAHKIHHLTEYLQALHKDGLASEDHTTLLLNCYTKLKDQSKLDEFIFKERERVDFDVDIAVKVCRHSGYNRHALALARKHGKHEWYLRMQIEDLKDFADALDYIGRLEFAAAEHNLRKYGGSLMHRLPDETTELLKVLCTNYRPKEGGDATTTTKEEEEAPAANAEDFLHLFVKNSDKMVDFLEYMIRVRPTSSDTVYNTLLEHYLHQYSAASSDDFRSRQEDKVMAILKREDANFDHDQALILCQLHSFRRGTLHLLERKHLHAQIVRHHLEFGDVDAAVAACRQHGPQDPNLWVQLLQQIALDGDVRPGQIAEVLEQVESQKLMAPLMVVGALARSANASLGLVRDFLLRVLKAEDRQLKEDVSVIEQYRADTARLRRLIHELKTESAVFQVSKCSACHHALELPSVHFLCKHSFHQHCFESYADADDECPACHPENRKILDIIQSQERTRDQHDAFRHQLETAESGFGVVAEYFGRGVFRNPMAGMADELAAAEQLRRQAAAPAAAVSSSSLAEMVGPGAEARIRAGEQAPSTLAASSEGRMRLADSRSGPQQAASEARLRMADSRGGAAAPTEARRRQHEGGTLDAHMTREKPEERKKHAAASVRKSNPFDESSESTNPFGDEEEKEEEDLGENNPFAEDAKTTESKNPFGDDFDDDYDESLNPFGQ